MDGKTFDPMRHLMKVQGKDYLPVAWRLVWMHDRYPEGCDLRTHLVSDDGKVVLFSAVLTINNHEYVGHGTAPYGKAFPPHETAETSAIGRALAHAGLGTQFTEYDEPLLADSPVERQGYDGDTHYSGQDDAPSNGQAPATGPMPGAKAITAKQHAMVKAIGSKLGWKGSTVVDQLTEKYGVTSTLDLDKAQVRDYIDYLKRLEFEHAVQEQEAQQAQEWAR
jgi:hypothetical protein